MSRQDQLLTGSFHVRTWEGYETYFSESMIPEIDQLTGLMHVDSQTRKSKMGIEKEDW
jgi:hypothetical protein